MPIDFNNTEIAFEGKTDAELIKTKWLFSLMNKNWLVNIGSKAGLWAVRLHLPFAKSVIKHTIFEQFCGGTNFEEMQRTVDKLAQYHTLSALDYGVEAANTEKAFESTMKENLRAIEFASVNESAAVVVSKISGLARNELLEKIQQKKALSPKEQDEFERVRGRLDNICKAAHGKKVAIFLDAEESWIQDTLDMLADEMMAKYNKSKAIVYNTFQMYRHDRLAFLKASHAKAKAGGYLLGAKLVRGAYMVKERERAEEMGYPSPIQPDKPATDRDFNAGIRYCIENYTEIASCNASHNQASVRLQVDMIDALGVPKNHPNLNFCQLMGMSDHLTFNLAKAGYNVAKYVVYGKVKDVLPYLIRRAQENASVTGDLSRELAIILKEVKRRKLAER
jgi:proline dehydrogenase